MMRISFSAMENCMNHNSYGMICVHCNCCGRIDPETAKEAQIAYYKECLVEDENFNNWIEGMEEHQEKVRQQNIKYHKSKLSELGIDEVTP